MTVKRYSNGEVIVIWQSDVCIHSGVCFRGLPEVFDPRRRPWVSIEGATTQRIVGQVRQCPSGALSYVMNAEEGGQAADADTAPDESSERPSG